MLFKLLQYLLGGVLDDVGRVRLRRVETAKVDLFCLQVERRELGRLLGRNGRTVEAIRQVMNAIAAQGGKEAIIDVMEARTAIRRSGRPRSRPRSRTPRRSAPRATPAKQARPG